MIGDPEDGIAKLLFKGAHRIKPARRGAHDLVGKMQPGQAVDKVEILKQGDGSIASGCYVGRMIDKKSTVPKSKASVGEMGHTVVPPAKGGGGHQVQPEGSRCG